MENFNAFINELQTLKINVNEYRYEVGDYNQYSNYEYELKRLQQAALNDLTILSKEQLENYLRRLSQPQKRFVKIWEFYQRTYSLFRENNFEFSAFNKELKNLFIIENFNAVLVTEQFFFDLHDAIVLKEGYLLDFEAQLREVFGLNVDAKNNAEKHADVEATHADDSENNFTLSTIEDWLYEFKDNMSDTDYKKLTSALIEYFDKGSFPKLSKPIQINGKPNKKFFGWALSRIFVSKGKGVEKELLLFAKHNISLYANTDHDENDNQKSNLYKYFTTKPK